MKKFLCEEMMCDHCVSRIDKALADGGIDHEIDLPSKTVTIHGDEGGAAKAVELLDDLGFSAVECL